MIRTVCDGCAKALNAEASGARALRATVREESAAAGGTRELEAAIGVQLPPDWHLCDQCVRRIVLKAFGALEEVQAS